MESNPDPYERWLIRQVNYWNADADALYNRGVHHGYAESRAKAKILREALLKYLELRKA